MSETAAGTTRRLVARLSPAVARSRAEWWTDGILFGISLLFLANVQAQGVDLPAEWLPWDVALGVIASASIWWTRRYPLMVGALMIVPGALALTAATGALVAVYRMGLLAPVLPAVLLTAAHISAALPYHFVLPVSGMNAILWLIVIPLLYALCLCIGLLGRARRQVIVGLRAEAARERERYEERLLTSRRDERQRIAREMHDVLAHRISLLSMHAGALEYRAASATPPTSPELAEAAHVIRENASAAVEDLRELLGLLRSDDELGTGAPQPRLSDLESLVDDAAAAGQRIELSSDARPERLRETTQRTAYRVVQEALTNARKHAPHALVHVRLHQERDWLSIETRNAVQPGMTLWDLPPAGNGLIGLEERVRIDGGTFSTTIAEGEFQLRVDLPLAARS
jgi:signal transduction histidine kinase